MIRWFNKEVADSISREGTKLIKTLLPDEDSSITEYKYKFNWCEFLTPCPIKNDTMIGDYDCIECCPHFVNFEIVKSIESVDGSTYAPYFEYGTGILKCKGIK